MMFASRRFVFLLGVLMLHTINAASTTGPSASGAGCLSYASNCSSSSMCCFYPSILCLPDAKNGTSCLSIFDVVNLNPQVSGVNVIGPLLTAVGNSSSAIGQIQEVVKVNGNTVYNVSELITPSTTVMSLG